MSNDLKFTLRFNAETKSFIGEVKAADGAVNKLGDQSKQTSQQMKAMDTSSAALSSQLNSLKSRALGLAGGFSVLFAASNAKDTLATYQDIRTQITALVGGQAEWAETEQYLKSVSQEHNKVLTDMTGNYARLISLQESGLLTQREVRDLFEGMSNAQSQTGASTAQLEQSMYGLSQALASPIVRAEELNQVVEPMPGLLNKLDKAAGLQAGGFRNLMLAGEVTSEMFKTTLIKALDEYQGAAARTADNINAKENELITSYQNVVTAFETPISDSYTTVLEGLSGSLNVIADNAEIVTDVVGVGLAVAFGRGAAQVTLMTTAKLNHIVAQRNSLAAAIEEQKATVATTAAEVRRLETLQLTNNQLFRATGGEKALGIARIQLASQTEVLSASQARANITARALNTTMSLAGGPVGLVMMAAGALAYFGTTANDSKLDTKGLKDEVNALLGRMGELKSARIEEAISKQKELISQLEEEYRKVALAPAPTQSLWEKLTESNSDMRERQKKEATETAAQVSKISSDLQQANSDLDALQNKLSENKNAGTQSDSPSDVPPVDATNANDQASKLLETLQRQRALYGQTSEAAKVRYDIEYGSLKGINDELAKKLILEAESLDKKKADSEPQDTSAIETFYAQTDAIQNNWNERLAIEANMEEQAKIQEIYSYQERLDSLDQYYQNAIAAAEGHADQLLAIDAAYKAQKGTLELEHQANLTAIKKEGDDKRQQQDAFTRSMQLNGVKSWMGQLATMQNSENKRAAAAGRAAARVQIMINTYEMATKSYNALAGIPYVGPFLGAAAAATAVAFGMAQYQAVGSVVGQAHDGINRVPAANEGTWMLKQDEMVMNTEQADSFRWMVSIMQQMRSAISTQSSTTSSGANSSTSKVEIVNEGSESLTVSKVETTNTTEGEKLKIYLAAAKQQMLDDVRNGGDVSRTGEQYYGWKRTGQ